MDSPNYNLYEVSEFDQLKYWTPDNQLNQHIPEEELEREPNVVGTCTLDVNTNLTNDPRYVQGGSYQITIS